MERKPVSKATVWESVSWLSEKGHEDYGLSF